jgi:ribosomal protein S18 acetylase RimI-like enzyme
MEIRLLTPDDAGEWWRLRAEALAGDPEAFSSSSEEHSRITLDEVKGRLGSGRDSFVAGAFEDGRLIGMAGFHRETGPKTRHKGRIWGVYVTPAKRGDGTGRGLLRQLLDRAGKIQGLEQIMLSVTETQTAAIGLYRSLGFVSFGREPRALKIGDRGIDEEYLVLRLNGRAGQSLTG